MSIDIKQLLAELKRDEGCRLHAYQDSVGVWSIGYGQNLQVLEIDLELAERWLQEAACETYGKLISAWEGLGYERLDEVRERAILNMAYNLGVTGFFTFKHFIAALNAKDWSAAATHMLDSKWADQVGGRARRLACMILTGQNAPDTAAAVDALLASLRPA